MKSIGRILAALPALFPGANNAGAQPLPDVTVGLGFRRLAGGSLRIAKEIDLFEKHGLNVYVLFTYNPTVAIYGLLSRSYQFVIPGRRARRDPEISLSEERRRSSIAVL